MTFAWYGHLKYRGVPYGKSMIASWGIAFFEYCFQVPANRVRLLRIYCRAAQNHPGGHHAVRLFDLLDYLSRRAAEVELRRGLRLHLLGAFFVFHTVVRMLQASGPRITQPTCH